MREGETFEGAAADRRARELARISAALKREVARGEHAGVELARPAQRDRPRSACSSWRSWASASCCSTSATTWRALWGYVVRAVLGELPADVHVIGLTATPPVSLPEAEAELYDALLGPVDFTVPTPAVVRDGHLAPYQELALPDRAAVRRARVAGRARHPLPRADHDPARRATSPEWVIQRLHRPQALGRGRDRAAAGPEFQKRSPKLARAGIRFLLSAGLRIPPGAPRRGVPPAARPRRLARAARGLRAALPGAASRRARPPTATRRSPPRCASSASTSPARASAAARPRSTGC